MKAVAVAALSFLALCSAATADTVYVPIVAVPGGTTEVHLANPGAGELPVVSRFLSAAGAVTPDAPEVVDAVPADSSLVLAGVAPAGESGLLAVEADGELLAGAWLASRAADGGERFSLLPALSERNALPAGDVARLAGLARDGGTARLGVVNLGEAPARCTVAADGDLEAAEALAPVVPARGLRFAPAVAREVAEVECDQPFWAFALVSGAGGGVSVVAPTDPLAAAPAVAKAAPGAIVYEAIGLLHTATRQEEKKRLLVPIDKRLGLKKMVVEFDVVPGPWHPQSPNGNHALIWVYRGRFRSNTIANVNAFGPGKDFVKMNQNVDLPARQVTNAKAPLALQRDATYHVRYVYDAAARLATTVVSRDGAAVATMHMQGTARNRTLDVAAGLVAEFGHYSGQHGPEVPSWGWRYLNLRVEMLPK